LSDVHWPHAPCRLQKQRYSVRLPGSHSHLPESPSEIQSLLIWDTLEFPGQWTGKTLAFFVDFWEKTDVLFCDASDAVRIPDAVWPKISPMSGVCV
jgi:hypothetical protein